MALARLPSRPSDVLLLDEPTNRLSPSLVEDLEEALTACPGTLLLVSHDRRLRARWPGDHMALPPRDAAPSPTPETRRGRRPGSHAAPHPRQRTGAGT
ncbi:hypothetical protein [Streptomyces sp. NPDC006134]|uniref:hypothetical protein n=1 Tax=Streptomyces sp. NPDC006134 TaxID=3154467 RepID=UPI003405AA8E